MHRIDVRTGTDELWVPQRTPIMSHRDAVGDLYGAQPEWHAMILSADDGNVLTPAGVDAVWISRRRWPSSPDGTPRASDWDLRATNRSNRSTRTGAYFAA